jgi:acetylornithine deacetylase/succinyl-diaminopimelate desuccinylase-like protein
MDVRDYIAANAALDADRIHAPNEYVDLSRLLRGAESIAYLREELAGAGVAA